MRAGRGGAALVAVAVTAGLLSGSVASAGASEARQPRNDVVITNDREFDWSHGVRRGSGTAADPYVISGWKLNRLTIRDTSKHVVIKDNEITSQLVLNWNGPGVKVVGNEIADLRVNQNVRRTGEATGGVIANNSFGIVGQLRHFDGVFTDNTVRPPQDIFDGVFDELAVRFDGFNGSRFVNNDIHGVVEVRLHGHHHGSSFRSGDTHYHGSEPDHSHHMGVDHSQRYHRVLVANNTIRADAAEAMYYTDTAHSANDRTAASETNGALSSPHVHYTRVRFLNNRLIGGGLGIQIFNARDSLHTRTERGSVSIKGNTIDFAPRTDDVLWGPTHGINVWDARDIDLRIEDNEISAPALADRSLLDQRMAEDAGIYLEQLDLGNVLILDNSVTNSIFGVRASRFTSSVEWTVGGLRTKGVSQAVAYDSSVQNPPRRRP